jgi:hypothetical protein
LYQSESRVIVSCTVELHHALSFASFGITIIAITETMTESIFIVSKVHASLNARFYALLKTLLIHGSPQGRGVSGISRNQDASEVDRR